MIFISFFFLTLYGIVFTIILSGFLKKNKQNCTNDLELHINVIIPLRNEEKNINQLIDAFERQSYKKVSYLFINDHSTDNTAEVLKEKLAKSIIDAHLINQHPNHNGKKSAIITGIKNARHSWIVTTDADTIPTEDWLSQFASAFANNNLFVIGPVINTTKKSFLSKLQNIEAIMLAGMSIGSAKLNIPVVCSGANLGYHKSLFEELKPYKDNLQIPSGDDQFFLDKIIESKTPIHCLDNNKALVFTQAPATYKELINQSIRWSSKNSKLKNKRSLYLSGIVFITNMLLLLNIFFSLLFSEIQLVFFILKFIIDFVFLSTVSFKYNRFSLILFSPLIYLLYPIHLLIIFVSSFFLSVKWKERPIEQNE